jgi:hypothetical protein
MVLGKFLLTIYRDANFRVSKKLLAIVKFLKITFGNDALKIGKRKASRFNLLHRTSPVWRFLSIDKAVFDNNTPNMGKI